MNPTTKPTGYVYIVIGDNSQHIKIGYSGNPEKRLKSLQTGTAEKLSIAKTWIAWKADESRIHRKLAQYRKHHEWFDLDVQSASLHISALLGRSDSPILKQSDLVVIQTGFLMKWHSDVAAVSQDLLWDIVAVMDKLRQFRDAKRTAGQVKKYGDNIFDSPRRGGVRWDSL